MKEGKLSEPVYKRSVLKCLRTRRNDVLSGPGIGADSQVLKLGLGSCAAVSEASAAITGSYMIKIVINRAVNNLAAMGAEPMAVQISFLCPLSFMESDLKQAMVLADQEAELLGLAVFTGRMESTGAVLVPYMIATGIGKGDQDQLKPVSAVVPEQDIVISKPIGQEVSGILAFEREKELSARFSPDFLRSSRELLSYISVVPEAAAAVKHGVSAMHTISEGGVFGALWELAEGAGVGLLADLKKIPIKQEAVELCEFFDINPYQAESAGSLLMVSQDGSGLVRELSEKGMEGTVIGRTKKGRDRLLLNGEETRFLEPPKMNELKKMNRESGGN